MDYELTLLAVPALAVLVLGVMLATAGRAARSMCVGTLGLVGVLFGGPSAVLVLARPAIAAPADDEAESVAPDADVGQVSNLSGIDSASASVDAETKTPKQADAVEAPTTPPASDNATGGTSSRESSSDDAASGYSASSASAGSSSKSDAIDSIIDTPLHEPISDNRVHYRQPLPDWVHTERKRDGREIDCVVVSTSPLTRRQDCDDALELALVEATNDYIDSLVHHDGASVFVNVDLDYIQRHLVKQNFHVDMDVPTAGPMQQSYALLEFDQPFRDKVKSGWDEARATSRLLLAGLLGGGILGLLGVLFSFFRFDNATRGFYTGRLQFAALATILAIIAAGVLLARWIPWL